MPSKLLILHGELKSDCFTIGCVPENMFNYYREESVLLGTKPLVDSIRHFIQNPSGAFSVCHLCECRIVQWLHDSRLLLLLNWFLHIIKRTLHVGSKIWILYSRGKNNREFTKPRRRRRGQRRVKNEFIFHLRLSRYSKVICFVYRCQNYLKTQCETQRCIWNKNFKI